MGWGGPPWFITTSGLGLPVLLGGTRKQSRARPPAGRVQQGMEGLHEGVDGGHPHVWLKPGWNCGSDGQVQWPQSSTPGQPTRTVGVVELAHASHGRRCSPSHTHTIFFLPTCASACSCAPACTHLDHVCAVVQEVKVEVGEEEEALPAARLRALLHLANEPPHWQVVQVHLRG